jgi:predicted nucleic acid-binding protein
MKVLRVYVDTSALGGCFDREFEPWSKGLLEDFRSGHFRPVLSEVTAAEVIDAPEPVREVYADLLNLGAEVLPVTPEALSVRASYLERGILGTRFENDMLHIALATIAEVDVLVSWNFRHIVRLDKIRLFNEVNIELGHKALTIYSPREVTIHGRDQGDPGS